MHRLVLLRHGESTWNQENRFTGWTDVGLTPRGITEATHAGTLLREQKLMFDVAYTSVLQRAIKTLWLALESLEQMWLPVINDWRLNERHYGALQGLNKAETAAKYGDAQVKTWRRSFDVAPPPVDVADPRHPRQDPRYARIAPNLLPVGESLRDTIARFMPAWTDTMAPAIRAGERVLIVAHGNSLRALMKHLEGLSDQDIMEVNIPTGIPLVYELDGALRPERRYYLGDPQEAARAAAAVAAQGKAR